MRAMIIHHDETKLIAEQEILPILSQDTALLAYR